VQVTDLGSAEHAHAVRLHYTPKDWGFLKHEFDWIAFRIYRGDAADARLVRRHKGFG
jgi:hypothetical protein